MLHLMGSRRHCSGHWHFKFMCLSATFTLSRVKCVWERVCITCITTVARYWVSGHWQMTPKWLYHDSGCWGPWLGGLSRPNSAINGPMLLLDSLCLWVCVSVALWSSTNRPRCPPQCANQSAAQSAERKRAEVTLPLHNNSANSCVSFQINTTFFVSANVCCASSLSH